MGQVMEATEHRGLCNRVRRHALSLGAALVLIAGAPGSGALATAAERSTAPGNVTDLATLERAFASVIDQVSPSVVALRGIRIATGAAINQSAGDESGRRVIVNGAGTILSADGLILTNEHVVANCESLIARLSDGTELNAETVAADPRSDLAILRIPRTGLTPARFCNWSTVARGQWCVAMGNPYGLALDGQASVAIGVISNLRRQLPGLGEDDDRFYYDMIQTTASIHPGHSGGPLFNLRGELIGVVTAMHTHAAGDDGVGFATPLTDAKRRLIDRLVSGQPIQYGYFGALVRMPSGAEREAAGRSGGVVLQRIESDGPAARAGLIVGDLLLSWDSQPIWSPGQLAELVGQAPSGARATIVFIRDGRKAESTVELEARDAMRAAQLRSAGVVFRRSR